MEDIFRDPIESYKNFNMGTEIDIAGIFIYNGIKELDAMETFYYESEVFAFLYPISVGIERLQKVLIVLAENISEEKVEEFEKSLITHNHQELHGRIKKCVDIKFNSRQNSFLQVLSNFYKNCRYERFNIKGQYNSEKQILIKYVKDNLSNGSIEKDMFGNEINTIKTKELLGRVVGSIARNYYDNIYILASNKNLYTYELVSDSKASKVFLSEVRKNSLQEQVVNEQTALKEFLVFLINTKSKSNFYDFIKEIEPLEFDIALANSYLESVCKGNIPSDLVDEVEFLYGESGYSKDRIEMINCIGDDRVDFGFGVIIKLKKALESLISGEYTCDEFVNKFLKLMEELEYDEVLELLKAALIMCNEFEKGRYNTTNKQKEFINGIKVVYEEFTKLLFSNE